MCHSRAPSDIATQVPSGCHSLQLVEPATAVAPAGQSLHRLLAQNLSAGQPVCRGCTQGAQDKKAVGGDERL